MRWSDEKLDIYMYHIDHMYVSYIYIYILYIFTRTWDIQQYPTEIWILQTCNKMHKNTFSLSTSSASRVSPVRRCQALSQSCTSAVIGGFTPLNLDPTIWTLISWSRSLYHWSITNGKGAHRVLFFLWNDGCLRCSTLVVWETPEIYVFFYLN